LRLFVKDKRERWGEIGDKLRPDPFGFSNHRFEIQEFSDSHDRFLIIDDTEVYHIGASLKDLGRKWFAFSKMNIKTAQMLNCHLTKM